ncbi:hypothetical protein GLYMA_05G090800v4 [Glycine max]|uniref:Uncharacterized protein n=1 Tax=Glycine max TaxID=3847 RepID=K7KNT0_SOYBN|nr:hypothetical protein GYH30_012014 [Glycine max]KRH57893.1 hypothetical protein GLYMA_05G090800v4 [Glycine max]
MKFWSTHHSSISYIKGSLPLLDYTQHKSSGILSLVLYWSSSTVGAGFKLASTGIYVFHCKVVACLRCR